MINISEVKGIGPRTSMLFNKININNVDDLVSHYPYRYDLIKRSDLSNIDEDDKVIMDGRIDSSPILIRLKGNLNKMNLTTSTLILVIGVAISIYKIAGICKIQKNKIVFQSGNNTLYLGTEYNACSEIWIRDNYFTSDQVENTKVATITVQRFTSNSGAIHIVGNTFEYLNGGNTFNLTGCTGKVNIKYNYFKDCAFKFEEKGSNTILAKNFYSAKPTRVEGDYVDSNNTYEIFLDEYNANPTYTNEQRIEDYESDATYN